MTSFLINFIFTLNAVISLIFCEELTPDFLTSINEYEEEFSTSLYSGHKFLSPVIDGNVLTAENSVFKQRVDDISKKFRDSIENIKSKSKQVDVIFLIDSSSSVGKVNFQSEIKFVKKLLSDFNVSYNYTRVALVTFSSQAKVIRHLDQISNPSEENDKCKLLNDDIPMLKFIGGGTFTYGALKEAEEIFANARKNSRKYIFLVTDGFSNGKSPTFMADKLKNDNVTIFTIGIQSGNSAELLNISSSPSDKHSFLLNSFFEFQSLARRALRTDYKIGENIKLKNDSRCSVLCEENDIEFEPVEKMQSCCDPNADCTCGSLSGHYGCACRPGYYGNGLRDQCFPCPNGTYWHISKMCRPCSDINHITIEQPALSLDQCVCKAGFRKTEDSRCEGITCPKLLPPENGYFVKQQGSCLNVLNAACGARCMFGFQLTGTSLRLCQENGIWSGTEVSCVLKTCPSLNVPYYGSIICRNRDLYLYFDYSPRNETFMEFYEDEFKRVTEPMPIDTECTYKCGPGYYLVGSRVRTCLPLSKWDGLHTTCKQVVCHPLPKPSYGEYEFGDCTEAKTPYGTNCTLICPEGFTLKGPSMKTCGGKKIGVWSHKNKLQKCVDVTPPTITCPPHYNITMKVTDGEYVLVKALPLPINVSDSSGMNVTVWLNPSMNETEGIKLPVGQHSFAYIASDVFNNKAECTFVVYVIDTIPPTVEHCLDPDEFLISPNANASHFERFVEWDEPTFYDNSNGNISITTSLEPGYLLPGNYRALYTAMDMSNNSNTCALNIVVKELTCNLLSSPLNGRTFCARNITHTWCEVSCNIGYGILDEEEDTYLENVRLTCLNNAPKWKYDVIPDCTILDLPNSIEQLLTISMDSESTFCNNSHLQNQIQNSLADNLRTHLCNDMDDCRVVSEIPECIEDDIEANDVSDKIFYNIVKRDIHSTTAKENRQKVRSNVRIKLYTRIGKRLGIWRKAQPLSDNVRRVKQELQTLNTNEQLKQVLNDMRIDVKKLKIDELVRCPDGSISRKYVCVQCPRGTYQDAAFNRCQLCPIGTFNYEMGQIHCSPCPLYFSTKKAGRTLIEECKQLCPPGSVAKVKAPRRRTRPGILNSKSLMPFCRKCNPGEYQPLYDATSCSPCPPGYTSQRASMTLNDCLLKESHYCQTNTLICGPFGYCIPMHGGNSLYRCVCIDGYIGAHCEQKMDLCLSAPCYNNGICYYVNHTSIACQCPPQFTGTFCQDLKESCNQITCLNGGSCFEDGYNAICECPVGFFGRFCEQYVDYCSSSPCETGICYNMPEGYECECPPGMLGKRCHLRPCDYLPCHRNAFCIDLPHDPGTRDSYICKCPKGLKGYDCMQVNNPCDDHPCKNNGQCIPFDLRMPGNISSAFETSALDEEKYEQFTCNCPPYLYGKYCEILTTPDFVLSFSKASTNNYVELKGPNRDLSEISFCAWVQTNDGFNYGSLISYATEDDDNMFTFTDYSGFILYVNGNNTVTDMVVNDGYWHFICVAWTSENGFYEIFLDGQLQQTGFNISSGKKISGNGVFILGQEQDQMGGGFSESESFIGNIAYFDIWDTFLRGSLVQEFYTTCEPYQGSIYSWTDFKTKIHGDVDVKSSEFCQPCSSDLAISNGFVRIIGNTAHYQCKTGYLLQGNPVRYCLRTSQWSLGAPFCEIVDCDEPPSIENGYAHYKSTVYGAEARYFCDDGYIFSGSPQIKVCLENGVWSGLKQECISINKKTNLFLFEDFRQKYFTGKVKCKAVPTFPDDMKVLYANDKGYFTQKMSEFPVGTFAEITCKEGIINSVIAVLICLDDGQWDGQIPESCENNYSTMEFSTTSVPSLIIERFPDKLKTIQTKIHTTGTPISSRSELIENVSPDFKTTKGFGSDSITKKTQLIMSTTKTTKSPQPQSLSSVEHTTTAITTENYFTTMTSTLLKSSRPLETTFSTASVSKYIPIIQTSTLIISTTPTIPTSTTNTGKSVISDKDFWINMKSYLFSGCSASTNRKSLFCNYQQDENVFRDLIDFEPPDSNDFQNMDVKLLNLLKKHMNLIASREDVPFERFMNLILYGEEKPEISERFSSEMEDSLRFVFCIYIDTISWDDNLRFSAENDDSSENITGKLKSLILKIAIPVYLNYQKRLSVSHLDQHQLGRETECNIQLAPEVPSNGIVVGILSTIGVENFDVKKFREKPSFVPVGATVLYACEQGFRLEGNSVSECDQTGKWNNVDYICRFTGCSNPPKPINMFFEEGAVVKAYNGERVHLRCKDGYTLHGNPELQCLATGNWTKVLARCARISCNKPKLPDGADIINGKSYLFQDKVLIECDSGEEIEITCQSDGTWSHNKICE